MRAVSMVIGLGAAILCGAGLRQSVKQAADDGKPAVEWVGAHSQILEKGFERVRTRRHGRPCGSGTPAKE